MRWKKKLGRLAASSPALGDGRVYVTLLDGGRSGRGRIVALRQRNGKRRWSRTLPSRSESSPLRARRAALLRLGERDALLPRRRTGKVSWTYRAAGAIKGSPTLAHGKLFFGDYGGRVQAVRGVQRPPRVVEQRRRALLRDRGGRRPARVHRQHRGARVRVLDAQRPAALVAPDRALRLRVGGDQPRQGLGADRVRRLLRRPLLRAQRAHRPGALDLQLGRQDLRLGDGDRPRRLLRRPRPPAHDRARDEDRPRRRSASTRAPTTRSSPTASTST